MKNFKDFMNEVKKPTGDLKKACWSGYTAVGTKQKNGRTVPNCVPEEVELEETKMTDLQKKAAKYDFTKTKSGQEVPKQKKPFRMGNEPIGKMKEEVEFYEEYNPEELFDILEEVVDGIAEENNIDPDILWENLEDVSDEELYETAAWRRKEGKSASGGLNAKGIASYRRENPGSKLKKAVTGKVKPGSKAAKRRKSFCARMGGMKGAMKKPNGEPTRKALALRKWKCR
jgi:Domain of unknown function (DUF6321)